MGPAAAPFGEEAVLNRYRGQRNHSETIRAVLFGGLLLVAWGATLATLATTPGEGFVRIVDTTVEEVVEMADVELIATARASE